MWDDCKTAVEALVGNTVVAQQTACVVGVSVVSVVVVVVKMVELQQAHRAHRSWHHVCVVGQFCERALCAKMRLGPLEMIEHVVTVVLAVE